MKIRELIGELEKLDQEITIVVPTDIKDYKFYAIEGIHTFDLEKSDGDIEKVACLSRYPSWDRVKKLSQGNVINYWEGRLMY